MILSMKNGTEALQGSIYFNEIFCLSKIMFVQMDIFLKYAILEYYKKIYISYLFLFFF